MTEISIVEAAKSGNRQRAIELLRSRYYQRSWWSAHTLYRLMYIASPAMAKISNRFLRGLRV